MAVKRTSSLSCPKLKENSGEGSTEFQLISLKLLRTTNDLISNFRMATGVLKSPAECGRQVIDQRGV
jgi:hypothetical protein